MKNRLKTPRRVYGVMELENAEGAKANVPIMSRPLTAWIAAAQAAMAQGERDHGELMAYRQAFRCWWVMLGFKLGLVRLEERKDAGGG